MFLSYFPHSGFHNQRIAFENALVLSRLLNRTLLVPPVRLGRPLRYVKYDRLQQYLVLSGKEGLSHCPLVPARVVLPPECLDYFDFTNAPWGWLINMTQVAACQPLMHRWNMTDEWVHEHLQVSSNEITTLRDSGPYDYRFLDTPTDVSPTTHKYLESVYIPTLAHSPKRLIQVGTLFGSSRLRLKDPQNVRVRKEVRALMSFDAPHLIAPVDAIRTALGGRNGAFLGAHVRIGDGRFRATQRENVRLVWWKLVHKVLGFEEEETLLLEGHLGLDGNIDNATELSPPYIAPDPAALRTPHPFLPPLPNDPSVTPHLPCHGRKHTSPHLTLLNTPLFVSTDAHDPRMHPALETFIKTFPCSFFLSDFPLAIDALGRLRSGYDGVPLGNFLEGMVEAMVVGSAWGVAGTAGSTFSAFVEDVLWRRSHGWEIVVRG